MARTVLVPSAAPGQYPAAGVVLTEAAADTSNFNSFVSTGKELLVARNTHATLAQTVTINSTADSFGRTGDITAESIVAGGIHIFGPFAKSYWAQSGGSINCQASDATVKLSVVQLP
jgi:hypothetical protein